MPGCAQAEAKHLEAQALLGSSRVQLEGATQELASLRQRLQEGLAAIYAQVGSWLGRPATLLQTSLGSLSSLLQASLAPSRLVTGCVRQPCHLHPDVRPGLMLSGMTLQTSRCQ